METREARIKIVLDTAAASRAVPGAAAAVPGLPDVPSTAPAVPGVPGGATASPSRPGGTAQPSAPGIAPAFGPAVGPGVTPTTAPGVPGAQAPAYQVGRTPDTAPTTTAEAGESASRPSELSGAARGAWKGVKQAGNAALGGGSLSAAVTGVIGSAASVVPVAGPAFNAALRAADLAERYGPVIGGALIGAASRTAPPEVQEALRAAVSGLEAGLGKYDRLRSSLDAVGAAIEPTVGLAAVQAALNRGRGVDDTQMRAQREALGLTFAAEYRIAEREMNLARARRRIGLINAGTQIGAQAAEYLGPTLDDAFREGMITGSRR